MNISRSLLRPVCSALLFGCLSFTNLTSAAVITGPIVNPANNHSYYLLSQNTWTASESEAVTLGGHLATINDSSENSWVYTTFGSFDSTNRNLWIGLYDPDANVNSTNRATRRTEFSWVSGTSVTFTAWSPVEPNNPTTNDPSVPELFGHIWNPSDPNAGTWNNFRDQNVLFGIGNFGVVEVIPEPSTWIFSVVVSMICLTLWQHRRFRSCSAT